VKQEKILLLKMLPLILWIFISYLEVSLCSRNDCCSSILLQSSQEVHKIQGSRLGFYSQLGYYGARPAYRQQGGDFYLFYHEDEQKWVDSRYFYGASLFSKLVNDMDGYCLEEYSNWYFYNRSDLMFSEELTSECSKIEDVCCKEITISSDNSELKYENKSFYGERQKESLGSYKAIGMINGRYVYQKENLDRFLEYGDRYWLVSTGVGKASGHIHHHGGSVCPEHIEKEWQISDKDEDGGWVWRDDTKLKISCIKAHHDNRPIHHNHNGGPVAQPYVKIEPTGDHTSYSSAAVFFGCVTFILLFIMTAFFGRRFYRAWGKGSHGKQLLIETLDM